jgi:hypothetical protein
MRPAKAREILGEGSRSIINYEQLNILTFSCESTIRPIADVRFPLSDGGWKSRRAFSCGTSGRARLGFFCTRAQAWGYRETRRHQCGGKDRPPGGMAHTKAGCAFDSDERQSQVGSPGAKRLAVFAGCAIKRADRLSALHGCAKAFAGIRAAGAGCIASKRTRSGRMVMANDFALQDDLERFSEIA